MKTICLILFFTFAANATPACPDLSGHYSAPWNTKESQTSFSYTQKDCSYIIIGGYAIDDTGPSSTQYQIMTANLDGSPPVGNSFGPCWGVAPGVCASYTATPTFIIKSLDKAHTGIRSDSVHGVCTYNVSYLSKDGKGNLNEDIKVKSCEDGFTGKIAPLVFSAD